GGAGQLMGGVVANSIVFWADNVTGGVTATVAGTNAVVAVPRTVTLTSVATPTGGGAASTVKVVATFPTTANGYPTIVSWRTF
ncbi:MAG: hypothetical protein JWL73_2542, partial [Actinomycetia bacterium]|nr:hypothetical protein [Actinomycetes bacterium]